MIKVNFSIELDKEKFCNKFVKPLIFRRAYKGYLHCVTTGDNADNEIGKELSREEFYKQRFYFTYIGFMFYLNKYKKRPMLKPTLTFRTIFLNLP